MRGSLDQPPIVIGGSWAKVLMVLLGSIFMLSFTLLFLDTLIVGIGRGIDAVQVWFGVPVIAIFAASSAYVLVLLVVPSRVEIDSGGIAIRVLLRRTHYPWDEIVSIEAVKLGSRGGPLSFAALNVHSPGGVVERVLFPQAMELRVGKLVATANAARQHWGKAIP